MNKLLTYSLILFFGLCSIFTARGQEGKPNRIHGGVYLKLGAVIPVGTYAAGQDVMMTTGSGLYPLCYLPAKIGAALDMGTLIYIGPAFANKFLRAGIDATFLTISFNSTNPYDPGKKAAHYYYFVGQKFGPVITVNPIDRLMIDLSWKLNANASFFEGEWDDFEGEYSKYGMDFIQQEISLTVRYSIMAFSFQYNYGNMKYNNFTSSRQKQIIDLSTIRILIGIKF